MNIVFATGYGPNYSFLDLGQAVVTTKKIGTLRFIWKYIITFSEYSFFYWTMSKVCVWDLNDVTY